MQIFEKWKFRKIKKSNFWKSENVRIFQNFRKTKKIENVFFDEKISMTFLKSEILEIWWFLLDFLLVFYWKPIENQVKITKSPKFRISKNVIEIFSSKKKVFEKTQFFILSLYFISNLCKFQCATPTRDRTVTIFVLKPPDFGERLVFSPEPSYMRF